MTALAAAPTPRVSVVITAHNRGQWIGRTIDSVLVQSFRDFEVIVVDDGSTDDTPERVAAYGSRVRYIRTENRRAGHARNVGMSAARGRYLTFVDDDDLLYPYMLEVETAVLDRCPEVGMVYAEMSGFDDHGYFDKFHLKTYHAPAYNNPEITYDRIFERSVPVEHLDLLPESLLGEDPDLRGRRAYFGNIFNCYLRNIVVFQNNMLVRREVVEDLGRRDEHLYFYEELEYILRLSRKYRVCFIDVPTYKLRYHPGQVSSLAGPRGKHVWMRKQKELLHVVKRHVLADPEYYWQHREVLDRQLADLHRSVAVPLLLLDGATKRRRDHARRARKFLDASAKYGRTRHALWLLTFAPGPVRSLGVSAIETVRATASRWRRARLQGS